MKKKKQKIASIAQGVEEMESLGTVGGIVNGTVAQKTVMQFLKKLKKELLYYLHTKELKAGSHGDICTPMFTAASFTRAKRGSNPNATIR